MKLLTSLLALAGMALTVSGCANADGKVDNNRIHGAVGVGMASQNMSRVVPTRPGIEPPPSSSTANGATASGTTPFIPGQTSY